MDNSQSKLEQYADMQAMVQKEIETQFPKLYEQYATKFGVADVPLHKHNKLDSNQVAEADLIPKIKASGSIKFATNATRYTLQLTGTPTFIMFYGNAVHRSGGIDIRAMAVGSACLGPSYFFQPLNTTTVSPSAQVGNVIQSGQYLLAEAVPASGGNFSTLATEGHLVQVVYSGSIVAQATIPNPWTKALWSATSTNGYGNGFLYVDVDLAAGWEINGNFVVM